MLSVEQYITKMKKKDNLDEFNFKNHAENMSTVLKYVMDYFNHYLNPEEYDYENIKTEQSALKITQEIEGLFPESKGFVIEYYKKTKSRIDRLLKSWMYERKYVHLIYSTEEYENTIHKFCSSAKMKGTEIDQYRDQLIILAKEIKAKETEKPSISGFKYLDNSLVSWVKEAFRSYGVNLFEFAQSYTGTFFNEYIERIYIRESEQFYYINRYNHRYNDNPFNMDILYRENEHRPFINGRKGELEMLIMYVWVFENANDEDYWPEYVNLCISTGRVSLVKRINVLVPVTTKDMMYPADVKSNMIFLETTTGTLKVAPNEAYILRLSYEKDNDLLWKDTARLDVVIKNLMDTFSQYGIPDTLELLSPLRSQTYGEEEFFKQFSILEKSLKKYKTIKIALVNGPQKQSGKLKYLMQTAEDVVNIHKIVKEMKFKLKFTIDISKLIKRKTYKAEFEEDFNRLTEIRTSIIGIHLSKLPNRTGFSHKHYKDGNTYLYKYDYPENSDFLGSFSAFLNDNLSRYVVPEGMASEVELEELVDDLLRGGFSFFGKEGE
ncbi:hypothetical protein ACQKI4_18330 [Paenibacillus glucanolyticus]|uniref:Uncharacterized protein n=4 Tax=Paenibacillaceae TaxID=186822 RepID=A0A7Z2ZQV1_9BACL|nr:MULTISPECIES: hypothetical protein [Paenibacillaceae]MCK8487512.1 hypothetical protein [Paenibacillus mellifer]MCT1400960.1 hypothetical protein [Paenibacillus sp. p3-SID867]QJD88519.1 hypothetical protein HH215_35280 [Cohnella herbarum]